MRRSGWALAAIVVLAAVLRFATLGVQSYWYDEAITVHLLRDSLTGMVGAIPDSESTPPLYYVIAWFWSKLFGTGEVGLRALSAVLGVALVPLAYAIALRWSRSTRIGLMAALLIACNPLLIWYSQEARAYALLVLLSAATLLVLPDALNDRVPRTRSLATNGTNATRGTEPGVARPLLWWAVLAGLSLLTHYFALFVVLPEAVWLLRRRGREAVPAVVGVGVAGLAVLPIALVQASNDGARFIRDLSLGERVIAIPKQILVGYDSPGEVVGSVLAGVLVLVVVWLLFTRAGESERRVAGQLALLGLVAVAIPLVLSFVGLDYLITRNLLAGVVPLALALAVAAGFDRAGALGAAAGIGICVIGVAMYIAVEQNERYQREDWKGIANALDEARGPHAIVVSPANGSSVLDLYRPGVRRAPNPLPPLQEIWVVAVAERQSGEESRPPKPTRAQDVPSGFVLTGTRRTDGYSIATYRALEGKPIPVDPNAPRKLAFNGVPVSELVEGAQP